VRAEAEAVGPGEATIVLRDHTLALVDELDLVVREASSLSLKYEGRSVDFPVAVMSGQTASIRATLHSEAGSALGHDGFETEEDPGEALNTYGCREWICLSGSGDGPLSMVRAFYGNAEESLWVRPVTRAGYLETVVSPVYETDLRVRVYLAVASREGELVLHPSYKVHPAGGRASGYTAYETHFDVVLEEPEDEPRVRVASGGLSEVVDLGGRTEHEGAFWTAAERVVERAENEEPAGCAVAPGGTPARSAAALALAALAGLLRRRRQRSSQTASTAVRRA